MTVYAVNMTHDDVSPAQQFGDVKFINLRYVYGDEIVDQLIPSEFGENLAAMALKFNPADDYLLIVGDHLQLVTFAAYLARILTKPFRVLRWDKKAEGYIPVWV